MDLVNYCCDSCIINNCVTKIVDLKILIDSNYETFIKYCEHVDIKVLKKLSQQ